ncbi:DEAD/DEAH box helicase family protein [Photorhabdus bodei]|uniref:Type III restriction endonuclease subunit R n=1 Tax=Photorhabdus bodei TaxID=2029681 RepID=A0A329X0Q2_9GAMM|nr:DEAD/DEAH box helicase family protein [Photorhabdus bodei]NDK99748.1 type III restriction endonuclease subunit R [Photorhabdus bodei]NDL04069.1 type III restriction endonuclease subunit R [Photorhabdus bodei]NDL08120.1 type III restriction endonuclease subunit R [Photorhabdus bodei]RAX08828.1 type III restriction endonuclease subunit R [Photorhabdus bodei]
MTANNTHHVNRSRILKAITGRLSLRKPQEQSLHALAKAIEAAPDVLSPTQNVSALLKTLSTEFPTLSDFERDFPSLCFALATGVGKTRLMGAFITYLHLAYGIKNFFVLAPNLTIYNKLIADFTPNTPKYVFTGIAEFAVELPIVITGDNYEEKGAQLKNDLFGDALDIRINIFNISKIVSEVRGGKAPRIKRLSEYLGDSYFSYLAELDDLVLLMDESHRYRASAGMRAINELKPRLGLELTATPFTESNKGPVPFENVIVDYPLACAMDDGFVKEPAVVTQRNFDPKQYSQEQLEGVKLEDGVRLHEATKLELFTYAKLHGVKQVKPFMLVIARDTSHAAQLLEHIESDAFFNGRYQGKAIQVDSSKSGAAEEEMITRLLAVESVDEPTEIVIHVNMLKEGWDVTNLYTIVPLRAANARTLIEQSIGRGLRLPYGKRIGVDAIDRLNIVAHDRFQEIVDEANNPNNPLRMRQVILEKDNGGQPKDSVAVISKLEALVTGQSVQSATGHQYQVGGDKKHQKPIFSGVAEKEAAIAALRVLQSYQNKPSVVPTSKALLNEEIQQHTYKAVSEHLSGRQQSLLAEEEKIDLYELINKTTQLVIEQTIDIPRIMVVPSGEITYGYTPFLLDMGNLNLQPSNRDLIIRSLQTDEQVSLTSSMSHKYQRLEDYVVEHLVDYDDISYDEHAELIYDLATQAVNYFCDVREYSEDELHNIFFGFGKRIADTIHAQMAEHYWEKASSYEVTVTAGFIPLKDAVYTTGDKDIHNVRTTVQDKSKIKKMLFGGFKYCLYDVQKFDSDTERTFALILEREAQKWFKPVSGQFQIYYKDGVNQREYLPDFVAEVNDKVIMVETKARADLTDAIVLAKAEAAKKWCKNASEYLGKHGGKPWEYWLIPHDEVLENRDLSGFVSTI